MWEQSLDSTGLRSGRELRTRDTSDLAGKGGRQKSQHIEGDRKLCFYLFLKRGRFSTSMI